MIENPHTGERIEFVEQTADVLVMEATWPRPGRRALYRRARVRRFEPAREPPRAVPSHRCGGWRAKLRD